MPRKPDATTTTIAAPATARLPASVRIVDGEAAAHAAAELIAADEILGPLALALRIKGYRVDEIAAVTGADRSQVLRALAQERAAGRLNEVLGDIQHEAVPLAVAKLLEKLELGEEWAIKETLRGTGIFRTYTQQAIDARSESRSLEVIITQPPVPVVLDPAGIVGRARGEVRDATVSPCRLEGPEPDAVPLGGRGEDQRSGGPGEDARCELPPTP